MNVLKICGVKIPKYLQCVIIGILNLCWLITFLNFEWSTGLYIFGVIGLLAAPLLIYGSIVSKSACLLPWMIFSILVTVLLAVSLVFDVSVWLFGWDLESYHQWIFGIGSFSARTMIPLIFIPIFTMCHLYFMHVVWCYYAILREENISIFTKVLFHHMIYLHDVECQVSTSEDERVGIK